MKHKIENMMMLLGMIYCYEIGYRDGRRIGILVGQTRIIKAAAVSRLVSNPFEGHAGHA